MRKRLFFGTRDAAHLLEAGVGFLDDGLIYNVLAKTDRVAPGGTAGECVFTSLYLSIVHFSAVSCRVTPIIDGVAQAAQVFALSGTGVVGGPFLEVDRKVDKVEVGLSVPLIVGGIERLRTYPRGTWVQALVETTFEVGGSSYIRFDEIDVEHEIVVAAAQPVGV